MAFRINEAIGRAKDKGIVINKKDLASKLFPGKTLGCQQVKMSHLCCGNTIRIQPEWVKIICEACGCSADYLFGLKDE